MNRVRRKLAEGKPALGHMVLEFFSPGIGVMIANAGLDFVIFDMEHSRCGIESLAHLFASCRGTDIAPMVRVPDPGFVPMSRVLDLGAKGVMVPRVETRRQTEDIVAQLRYAPAGRRGVVVGMAHDLYRAQGSQYFEEANRDVLAIIQVETARALENLTEIISTPGVDIIWIGHYDLSVSLGIPGQFDHSRYQEAVQLILACCQKYGVIPAYLASGSQEAKSCLKRGFRVLSLNYDVGLFTNALSMACREMEEFTECSG